MLVGQGGTQDRVGELGLDEAVAVELWVVFFEEQVVVGADLATVGGDGQDVERTGEFAEGGAGDDERRVPVEDAPLLDASRECWIGEVDPVNAAELDWVTVRCLDGAINGPWHPSCSSPLATAESTPSCWVACSRDVQALGAEIAGNPLLEWPLLARSLIFRWLAVQWIELAQLVGLERAQDHGLRHAHQLQTFLTLGIGFVEQGVDDISFVGGAPLGERRTVSACGICRHCALTLSSVTRLAGGLVFVGAVARGG